MRSTPTLHTFDLSTLTTTPTEYRIRGRSLLVGRASKTGVTVLVSYRKQDTPVPLRAGDRLAAAGPFEVLWLSVPASTTGTLYLVAGDEEDAILPGAVGTLSGLGTVASGSAVAQVAVTNADAQIAAANAARRQLAVKNLTAARTLYVKPGAAAATTANGYPVPPGGELVVETPDQIRGILDAAQAGSTVATWEDSWA